MTLDGRGRRLKGGNYERHIARVLRAAFAGADVYRSSQADRARDSDVVATGHPVLERLWLELQDARKPTPREKLGQAERDCTRAWATDPARGVTRWPVAIWHRTHERKHWVTTRLWVLDGLRGVSLPLAELGERLDAMELGRRLRTEHGTNVAVTLELGEFVDILRAAVRRADKEASMAQAPPA